jgi:uncharacterized protein (DUF1810 family)
VSDPFDLQRFVDAQDGVVEGALAELRAGAKRGHWMWFVFPQMRGLGRSGMADFYGISGVEEARAYLAEERTAEAMLGAVDAAKLRSCLTLFEAAGGGERFARALAQLFAGERDSATLVLVA